MQNVEEKALETYQNNISFFKENYEELHKKIALLELAINTGQYQERYALEYKDDSYFDIMELATGKFLYDENSLIHAKAMEDSVNTKRTGGIFKGQRINPLTDEQAKKIDQSELGFHNALWATAMLTNYTDKFTPKDSYMKHVYKIIFIEVGLGLHLEQIINKLGSKVIFIKEPNLETFRLSLFVTDYKEICKNRFVYFSITNNPQEEQTTFIDFLNKGNNHNLNFKHIPFSKEYGAPLRNLQSHVYMQSFINYGYSAELFRFITSPIYLAQGYSFLNVSKIHEKSFLKSKPVLLLLSGPSTSKNIEWLKENHHKFVTIAALSTCKLLHSADITPDIVVHIDPGVGTANLFTGIDYKKYFKNTVAILASNVNSKTIEKFHSSKIHLIEQGTYYKKGFGRLSAPSVGEYNYALSLILGAIDIYMLGMDLALDNETLQSHGSMHHANQTGKIDEKTASLDPKTSVQYIKGNFLEQVPTTAGFKMSIEQFEIFTDDLLQEKHNVYNLSNGAYLRGALPLKLEECDWNQLSVLNKEEIQHKLDNLFQAIGSDDFNIEDKQQLNKQIKEAKKLEKLILMHKKKKYANEHAYLRSLSELARNLSDMENRTGSNLAHVYYEYFLIVQSHINDLFNTKDLENPKKHIVTIDKILVSQLLKIATLYITTMQNIMRSNSDERRFRDSLLEPIDKNKIQDLYCKNGIGFFVSEDNLQDTKIITYMKDIYKRFPQVSIKLFYFSEKEKKLAQKIFKDELNRCEFIIPKNIYDIAKEIEILVDTKTYQELYLQLMKYSNEIFNIPNIFTGSIDQLDTKFFNNFSIYENTFNISLSDIEKAEKSWTRFIFETVYRDVTKKDYKIDVYSDAYEFFGFTRFEWLLNVPNYKRTLIVNIFQKFI